MRLILLSLTVLAVISCNSPSPGATLTAEEFQKIYLDSLKRRHPDVEFVLNSDFSITAKKGEKEFKHNLDNVYIACKASPGLAKNIISEYISSTADLYAADEKIDITNIIPVIKPVEYLDEVYSLGKDGKGFQIFFEKYNDQLIVVYAENSEISFRFLSEADIASVAVPKDSIKALALRNLDRILPEIERNGGEGVYIVNAGGFFETSLLLLPSIWKKEKFPVDGDFIVAAPNRGILMITGSNNKDGIRKIKEIAADAYENEGYPVSEHLYRLKGRKFEKVEL